MIPYSQLRNANRENLAEKLPLDLPFSIYLEPTNLCNFKCKVCPLSFQDYRKIIRDSGNMSLDLYEKIIDDIKQMGRLKSLKLYMLGEPLLNKDIATMVTIAKEKKITERIEITTNGSLLTPQLSRDLIEAGLDYLRVSVYSVDQLSHSQITQSKMDINKIFNNIQTFRKIRDDLGKSIPFIYIKMLDKFNFENQIFIKKYCQIADEINIEPVMNWNDYESRKLAETVYSGQNIYKNQTYFDNYKEVCPFAFYSLVISCNGDVTICCVDWNKGTKVGNLKENSLSEIWFGEKLKLFRKLHINRQRHQNISCRNCTFLFTCPDNLDNLSQEKIDEILNYKKYKS